MQEVAQHLRDADGVGVGGLGGLRQHDLEGQALRGGGGFKVGTDIAHQFRAIEGLALQADFTGVVAGDGEQVAHLRLDTRDGHLDAADGRCALRAALAQCRVV